MATIKGIKNRLGAAHRALNGACTTGDNKKAPELENKASRKTAARRALNGDYALVDNKPMVRLEPVEVKSGTIYLTKSEAMEATKKEELRVAEEKRLAEIEAWNRYVIKDDSDKTVGCINRDRCCGCGACFSVCPVHAITMEYNADGFLEPVVDYDKCTGCGLCRKICPSINTEYKNSSEPACYAAYAAEDVAMKSSSGGIFTIMANYVFNDGGVVCGAGYTDDFKVEHFVIEKPEDLDKIRRSKYVQADASKAYARIKEALKAGRSALFCGCGCHVAGLYATLKNVDTSKLYTIDLLCHGGPSPKLFEKYLKDYYDKDNHEIDDVLFRDKEFFGWIAGMTVKYKDGTVKHNSRVTDPFYKGFNNFLSTRKFCGACSFSKLPRQGDITLGDFWGVDRYNREYRGKTGTSIVSVNNEQGAKLWDAVKDQLELYADVPYEHIVKSGQPYAKSFKCHPNRDLYQEMIRDGASMDKAADYALKGKYDVGIYGVWFGTNYGSVATYYALHQIVRSFGLSVLMIDKPGSGIDVETADSHARRFSKAHYHISDRYPLRDIKRLNQKVDTFIIGSDQVWNRGISKNFGYSFYFDFADPDKKKIAFAASFGHDRDFCNANDRVTISNYMSKFDGISLRETSGVEICRDVYGIDSVRVLDPVFVAERKEFDALADQAKKKRDGKYMLAYILDPTPEKREAVVHLSEKLGLDVVVLLDGRPKDPKKNREIMDMDDKIVDDIGVEDWLGFFRNAEFVVTDSCHGMSFAIVFERNFIGLANNARGKTRFESLVDVFQVRDHYVLEATEIIDNDELLKPVDYEKVNSILYSERARSLEWLKDKLFSPKVVDGYKAYPMIDKRLADDKED